MSDETDCPVCDRTFKSRQAMTAHKHQVHNRLEPWQDETTMRYLYQKKKLSSNEIAEILPCNRGHVKRSLRELGIERRSQSEAAKLGQLKRPPVYRTHQGHEEVCTEVNGDHKVIGIHRLVAVAEWGIDAVKGKETHHKNGIGWDNRPENLELLTKAEHARRHYEQGDSGIAPGT